MPLLDHDPTFAREFPALALALQGQFRVERELGRGGMGVVYLAQEMQLERLVALKVLPAHHANQPETRERFLREARTAARLAHPNVVPVYRADEAGGTAFFAMAFVDGESLGDRVRDRGPLRPADAVPILRAAAWALAYAHARGVVHRDVKPENILLERSTGRTLVTDFGIAHHTAVADDARLTQDGYVLGTLHYMSPEQVSGDRLDGRSDLYALGVVAYQVLSGRLPFEGLTMPAVFVAHATKPAPPLRDVAPSIPPMLASVVDRCLAKHPDERYATGEALAEALERAIVQTSRPLRPDERALPSGLPERLDETQAAAIWRRAAQLQVDALHRLDARESLLRSGRAAANAAPSDGTGAARMPAESPSGGYGLADVAGAAEEAGISRQYVAMALAELPRGTLPSTAAAALGVSEREATAFLGTEVRSVGVTVEIPAPPGRTLRALGVVLQQAPYELQLRSTVGVHPLDGGVIVFDLPGPIGGGRGAEFWLTGTSAPAAAINYYWMATRQRLEARQVQVTLRTVPGRAPGMIEHTAVTMTADLRPGVRRNVRVSQALAASVSGAGGIFSAMALAGGTVAAMTAPILGAAVAVGTGIAAVCVYGYRRFYPGVVATAEAEMRRALEAIDGALQSESVFGSLPGPGRSLRGPATDGGGGGLFTMIG